MKLYCKPVLKSFSMATDEYLAGDGVFREAFNESLTGLSDQYVYSFDMASTFGAE